MEPGTDGRGAGPHEPWRDLRVGDRIRVVRMPSGYDEGGCCVHEDTVALYRHLVEQGTILTISRIGDPDLPWIEYRWVLGGGDVEYHYLAMNDDSWERADETE